MSNIPWSSSNDSKVTLVPGLPESSSGGNSSTSSRGLWDVPRLHGTAGGDTPTLADRLRIGYNVSTNRPEASTLQYSGPRALGQAISLLIFSTPLSSGTYGSSNDPQLDGSQPFGLDVAWAPRYVINSLLALYKNGIRDLNAIFPRLRGPSAPLPQLTFQSVRCAVQVLDSIQSGTLPPADEAPPGIHEIGKFSTNWVDEHGRVIWTSHHLGLYVLDAVMDTMGDAVFRRRYQDLLLYLHLFQEHRLQSPGRPRERKLLKGLGLYGGKKDHKPSGKYSGQLAPGS
ncbi:MAG: hypothetical protein MMC33_003750 [Icmadophila ericetorum]|nr:hypothetical protein [Icmadophila ericetorum]